MTAKKFFGNDVLLQSPLAVGLYEDIAALPIVDYHSHLSEREIAEDKKFSTITEFWLKCDHYKWRAMRSFGVDERYITGDADDREKFLAYAKVMPRLIGNPLYYWAHMELKKIFDIDLPLNSETAPAIYAAANEKLKTLSVRKLLKLFNVEYIATTDDPASDLNHHGVYDNVRVCPTFRADAIWNADAENLGKLGEKCGMTVRTLDDLKCALEKRLLFFISKGCTIADVSAERIPDIGVSDGEAAMLFENRAVLTPEQKHRFYSYGMEFLAGLYKKYDVAWQLHIGALRNINRPAFAALGADAGYDVMQGRIDTDAVALFLGYLYEKGKLPKVIMYTLNADALPALCTIAPCFPDVRIGAAWWFNDTPKGIRNHLETMAEYSALGASLGMLTDSRSFSSYCRFDFFRRILADYVAEKVNGGEFDIKDARTLLYDICYANPKAFMNLK